MGWVFEKHLEGSLKDRCLVHSLDLSLSTFFYHVFTLNTAVQDRIDLLKMMQLQQSQVTQRCPSGQKNKSQTCSFF